VNDDYDVIVIGSGAGGGTLAYRLAPTGLRVPILERGDYVRRELTAMADALCVGDHLVERLGAALPAMEAAAA
jgi:choline dehydrogenase-like flavoprotein